MALKLLMFALNALLLLALLAITAMTSVTAPGGSLQPLPSIQLARKIHSKLTNFGVIG
jgi:hypothetical protein